MYHITKEEFKEYDENGDIILTARDSAKYKFREDNYTIKSDTVIGKGTKTINEEDSDFVGQLPLDKVIIFQVEKKEAYKKPLTAMGIWFMVATGAVFLLIYCLTHPPW